MASFPQTFNIASSCEYCWEVYEWQQFPCGF